MEVPAIAAFRIYVRCSDCMATSSKRVVIPDVEDAPRSVDEFVESGAMASVRFACLRCESAIAEVIGVNEVEVAAA